MINKYCEGNALLKRDDVIAAECERLAEYVIHPDSTIRRLCYSSRWTLIILMLLGASLVSGCGKPQFSTEYGRASEDSGSINGTRAFADLFRERGIKVNRFQEISPRLNKYQTIVWIPNETRPPEQKVIDALNQWANRGFGRKIVYVGRDYDANLDYLQALTTMPETQNNEELYRQIAEARIRPLRTPSPGFRGFIPIKEEDRTECDWFRQVIQQESKGKKFSGPLSKEIKGRNANVQIRTLLEPKGTNEVLLKVDDQPFVFSKAIEGYQDGEVIVVSNASFLLNFGLVNQENRKLAGKLIDYCEDYQGVAFLESGPSDVNVRDKIEAHQPWAWVARPPLKFIVPHIIVWGVLFCFVFLPIFGRPLRFKPKRNLDAPDESVHRFTSTTSFRSHIIAMARLLQRSESSDAAENKVRQFIEVHGKDSVSR